MTLKREDFSPILAASTLEEERGILVTNLAPQLPTAGSVLHGGEGALPCIAHVETVNKMSPPLEMMSPSDESSVRWLSWTSNSFSSLPERWLIYHNLLYNHTPQSLSCMIGS